MSLLVAAPTSGAGKTTVTLGLLRAIHRAGTDIRSAKLGPDYIDPRFHEAATGAPCLNLDPWAMAPDRLRALASGTGPLIVEGAMGLFDGAGGGKAGSGEELAETLGLTVCLVLDCARGLALRRSGGRGHGGICTRLAVRRADPEPRRL